MKPKWTSRGSLLYGQGGLPSRTSGEWTDFRLLAGEGRDVVESSLRGGGEDVGSIPEAICSSD